LICLECIWYSACHFHFAQAHLNMCRMSEFGRSRAWIGPLLGVVLLSLACSRRSPDLPTEGAAQPGQTPFDTHASSDTDSEQSNSSSGVSDTNPPFQSEFLPSGTLLTISLKAPVVAVNGSKDSFEGTVDEPVSIDGNVLIPRGATVSGRIESARISKVRPDRGYVRLALDAVEIDSSSLRVQTASLFARQLPQSDTPPGTIRLEKGRRLTFRVTEPIFFHAQSAKN